MTSVAGATSIGNSTAGIRMLSVATALLRARHVPIVSFEQLRSVILVDVGGVAQASNVS